MQNKIDFKFRGVIKICTQITFYQLQTIHLDCEASAWTIDDRDIYSKTTFLYSNLNLDFPQQAQLFYSKCKNLIQITCIPIYIYLCKIMYLYRKIVSAYKKFVNL